MTVLYVPYSLRLAGMSSRSWFAWVRIKTRAEHSEPALVCRPTTDCTLDQSQFKGLFRPDLYNRGFFGRDVPILEIEKQASEVGGSPML